MIPRFFRFAIFILAGLLPGSIAFAQTDQEAEKQNIIEQRIEIIANSLGEDQDIDYTNLLEDLTYYFEHPLNLNTASDEELRDLYLISDIQINNLRRHLRRYGPLRNLYELQAVRGFDPETIRLVAPFVQVAAMSVLADFSLGQVFREGSSDLFLRYRRTLQQQAGYIADPENDGQPDFAGTPDYLYTRYRFAWRRNIIAGFTLEKDAGEALDQGPDFASAHLFFRDKGFVRAVALGDYQAQFGQGLTLWSGLGFGKSPFVLNVKKNATQLRPYTSVNEALFLRGAAVTIGKGNFELTTLFSSKNLSGNLELNTDSLASDDGMIVTSLNSSGLHRTNSERENRNAINEQVVAGNLRYARQTFSMGITGSWLRYDKPVQQDQAPYQIYRFSGNENVNVGADYQAVIGNANFFGEVSRSANGAMASLNGLVAALHPRLSVSAVHRWFASDYQVQYANVFAEGNNLMPSNERGIFIGMQANFPRGWTLSCYTDQVRFPWLRFANDAPGQFSDYLAQLNYRPDKTHEFYIRYRVRHTMENGAPEEDRIDYPVDRVIQNIRLNAIYKVHDNIQLRSRAEWNLQDKEGVGRTTGFLLYQDLIFKKMGSPVSLNLRYALFETASFDNAIYAYESDVLYAFSIPAHSGKGSRMYAMMKWDVTRSLDMWLRVAQWVYTDRETISEGSTNEIEGNRKTDVTVQLRWRF